jgi:hypothetical protein
LYILAILDGLAIGDEFGQGSKDLFSLEWFWKSGKKRPTGWDWKEYDGQERLP